MDHVALACVDVQRGAAVLETLGFETRFVDVAVPNHASKARFLGHYRSTHSIALCRATGGVALELTEHGETLADGVAPYDVLVGATEAPSAESTGSPVEDVWTSSTGGAVRRAIWSHLGVQVWAGAAGTGKRGVTAVMLHVADADRAAAFWSDALGFRVRSRGVVKGADGRRCPWVRLQLTSAIPSWSMSIVVAQGLRDQGGGSMLDARGFPCVAMLCTRMDDDAARLARAGASDSTGPFRLVVNRQDLNVAVFRAPGGELVELIEVARARTDR